MGFPSGSGSKESAHYMGDPGLIPGSGRFPGGGHGNPLVSLSGESRGQGSLAGYSPWGRKELDMTAATRSCKHRFYKMMALLPVVYKTSLPYTLCISHAPTPILALPTHW